MGVMEEDIEIIKLLMGKPPTDQEIRLAKSLSLVFQADYVTSEFKLGSVQKKIEKLDVLYFKIGTLIKKLQEVSREINNSVVLASLNSLASDLQNSNQIATESLKNFTSTQKSMKDFSKDVMKKMKTPQNSKTLMRRNKSKILNAALYDMYLELKSYSAIVKFFNKFPQLTPHDLGKAYDEDMIRQRIERYKKENNLK